MTLPRSMEMRENNVSKNRKSITQSNSSLVCHTEIIKKRNWREKIEERRAEICIYKKNVVLLQAVLGNTLFPVAVFRFSGNNLVSNGIKAITSDFGSEDLGSIPG